MQSINEITSFFGWCSVINIGLLSYMTLMLTLFRTFVKNLHAKMFGLSEIDLDKAYFNYLANYKIAILVFNLVPYVALKLMS